MFCDKYVMGYSDLEQYICLLKISNAKSKTYFASKQYNFMDECYVWTCDGHTTSKKQTELYLYEDLNWVFS